MKVVVIGGSGNFGARIVQALRDDDRIALISAGRRALPVPGAPEVQIVALDMSSNALAAQLRALSAELVIHCAGPFQQQDYRVALAALTAGAHYLDLADGRQFVAGFADALQGAAVAAQRAAICGASTLPALSSAVVDELQRDLHAIESIDIVIAPGQRAPRGAATLAAVFDYLGRPFTVWRDGRWRETWGWMDLCRAELDAGSRLSAACDVPDLQLFPNRYAGVRSVRFHAALELSIQHYALWSLAALRRIGSPLPVNRWAIALAGVVNWLDRFGGDLGGMMVSIAGMRADGQRLRRSWQLSAPALHGPEIPCMPAILLARQLAGAVELRGGAALPVGATACMGLLPLNAYAPEFAHWGITTRIIEGPA